MRTHRGPILNSNMQYKVLKTKYSPENKILLTTISRTTYNDAMIYAKR